MLMNFTRLCSESYIMGGITDNCLICFSLFCGKKTRLCVILSLVLFKHVVTTNTLLFILSNSRFMSKTGVPTSCSERPSMISEISCSLLAIVAERPVPLWPTLRRRMSQMLQLVTLPLRQHQVCRLSRKKIRFPDVESKSIFQLS